MIPTSPTMRILVATEPVDFRKGIDGLAAIPHAVRFVRFGLES